ncbi:MAG: hypothetical protein OHK0022_46700 [Roseiflexaceae bacterium]
MDYPRIADAAFDQFEQYGVLNVVKTAFDVALDDPEEAILLGDAAVAGSNTIHGAMSWPKAVRTGEEVTFPDRFEQEFEHHLNNPVFNGWDAQWALFAIGFWYPMASHCLWSIGSRAEFSAYLLDEGVLACGVVKVFARHTINAGCPTASVAQHGL